MKKIPLTQGKFALVDDADFDWINQWKWLYSNGYATRDQHIGMKNGKRIRKYIRMHRLINQTPDGFDTDHIDGDGLNNQRHNLRTCTVSQNMMNRKPVMGSVSKFKGVSWIPKIKKWKAQISLHGEKVYLGVFTSEIEAAEAYNTASKENHGEFARLNVTRAA